MELKQCPFCGGKAEIYTGRAFPAWIKAVLKSEEDAVQRLEEYKEGKVILQSEVISYLYRGSRMKKRETRWKCIAIAQGFIPRCCKTRCIGRVSTMFYTEKEAIDKWNERKGCEP